MKEESGGKNHDKICWIKSNIYSYLKDDGSKDKKSKRHKKVCPKRKT